MKKQQKKKSLRSKLFSRKGVVVMATVLVVGVAGFFGWRTYSNKNLEAKAGSYGYVGTANGVKVRACGAWNGKTLYVLITNYGDPRRTVSFESPRTTIGLSGGQSKRVNVYNIYSYGQNITISGAGVKSVVMYIAHTGYTLCP